MSDENEKVTIAITNGVGVSTRTVTDEWNATDTCWPHLVEVFLEQLQGLGYKFSATPEEMVDVLEDFHQELVCEECGACDEVEEPAVEEKKYPYTGIIRNKDGVTIVEFTDRDIGKCVYTSGHVGNVTGQVSSNWDESLFEKVSQ